jgi:hypothetical protein
MTVLRGLLRSTGGRRLVALVALVAFVCLVFAAAAPFAHGHDHSHHGHDQQAPERDRCGVCDAVALIGASESFAAPALVLFDETLDAPPPPAARVAALAPLPRVLAPRPPPALA